MGQQSSSSSGVGGCCGFGGFGGFGLAFPPFPNTASRETSPVQSSSNTPAPLPDMFMNDPAGTTTTIPMMHSRRWAAPTRRDSRR